MMLAIATPLALSRIKFFSQTADSVVEVGKQLDLVWFIGVDDEDNDANRQAVLELIPQVLHDNVRLAFTGKPLQGPAVARKTALDAALGEGIMWVQFLDADDVLLDGIKEVFELANSSEQNIGWIGSSRNYIGEHQQRPRHVVLRENAGLYQAPDSLKWENPMVFHPNNLMLRTGALHTVPYPTEHRYNEDALFMFSLSMMFDGLVVDTETISYRLSDQQVTTTADYLENKQQRFEMISRSINSKRIKLGYQALAHPFDFEQGLV